MQLNEGTDDSGECIAVEKMGEREWSEWRGGERKGGKEGGKEGERKGGKDAGS